MAIKLFISQPMRDRPAEEIKAEREEITAHVREMYGQDLEVIASYYEGNAPERGIVALKYLAKSIELLADADVAYFAKGWEDARGCRIENQCAIEYGIEVVEDYR